MHSREELAGEGNGKVMRRKITSVHFTACVAGTGVVVLGRSRGGKLLGTHKKGQVHWKVGLDPGYFEWLG